LSDGNGWRRQLGQRLLVERQDQAAVIALRQLLTESDDALARLHALWTLDGLSALTAADLLVAIDDADVHVRRDAVKLSAPFFAESDSLFLRVIDRANDEDVRVRFQVALALGDVDSADAARATRRAEVLVRLAAQDGNERWFALAILASAKDCAGTILAGLVEDTDFVASGDAERVELLTQLATIVGARGDVHELAALLTLVTAPATESPTVASTWWQNASLAGLATGLPRHRGALGKVSLPDVLAAPPEELAAAAAAARQLLAHTADIATDASLAAGERTAAVRLLAYQPFAEAVGAFKDLLTTGQPLEVQLATINAMQSGGTAAAEIILDRWSTLGPKARAAAQLSLLQHTDTTRPLLAAMADQGVSPSTVGIDDRVRLLRHGDADIKELATALFGGAISSNRREVAERYASALTLDATPVAGAKVFARTCAKCHRIDGHGEDVGPDISDVRNRSPEALLYDVLDPNLKVEPNYSDYTVITGDGRVLNGLMIAETADAVVLRQAEGKQLVIPRGEIEQIATSGQSLMPEGVEQDITVQQMADLLVFLKATPRPPISE
jgi:putative heme-binding domain-containing protein